jgi:alkanesulfonate monooxygenase
MKERFALLEDALQALPLLWGPGAPAFEGRVISIAECICYPRPIQDPRPPIMVGGGGERKTLRLVAQYADACNVFGGPPAIHRKYEILRAHCEAVGRDPDEIERSTLQGADPGREPASRIVDRFGELGDAGAQHVIFSIPDVNDIRKLETIGREVIPQLRDL